MSSREILLSIATIAIAFELRDLAGWTDPGQLRPISRDRPIVQERVQRGQRS